VVGVIYLTAVTVGRVFCGWACPFGMIQDFLSYLPFKKEKLTAGTISQLRDIKWFVVGFSLIISILVGYNRSNAGGTHHYNLGPLSDSPFTVFSPAGTLFTYLPWMLLWNSNVLANAGMVGWLKFAILLLSLVPSLYVPRFFCRYICPLGALFEPMSPYKFLRISVSPSLPRDEFNQVLKKVCPMDVQLSAGDTFISDGGCIHCGKCLTERPTQTSQQFFERSHKKEKSY
jgi:polyferredoxin